MNDFSVLIADDEKACRAQVEKLLAAHEEFRVSQRAADGEEALQKLRLYSFDLALLDIGMPGLTGLEVVKEARKIGLKLPYVIFATAFSHHGAEAFELGAVDYIVKPVSERRLAAALERFRTFREGHGGNDIKNLMSERFGLTAKELEICLLIKEGKAKDEIQELLGCTAATLKTHLAHIYDKTLPAESGARGDKFSRLLYLLFTLR